MCGNAFEALIGAIYLDLGYDACMKFMQERILHRLINLDKVAYKEVNFKSKLIEWSQKNKVKLDFCLVEQTQEECSPVFHSEVLLEGLLGGTGMGYSKKESQQAAAKQALTRLKKDAKFLDAVYAAKQSQSEQEESKNLEQDFIDEAPVTVYTENQLPKKEIILQEDIIQESESERIIMAAEEKAFNEENK